MTVGNYTPPRPLDVEIIGALIALFDYSTSVRFEVTKLEDSLIDYLKKTKADQETINAQMKAYIDFNKEISEKYKTLAQSIRAVMDVVKVPDGERRA